MEYLYEIVDLVFVLALVVNGICLMIAHDSLGIVILALAVILCRIKALK